MATGERDLIQKYFHEFCEFHTLGDGFTWDTQDKEKDIASAKKAWGKAKELILDKEKKIILLDEINIALRYGYIEIDDVVTFLQEKITLSPPTSLLATLLDFKHWLIFSLYTHSIILPFKCKSRATTPSFSYFSPPTYSLAPEALDISKHSINGNATIKANIDDLLSCSIFVNYIPI